MLKIIATLAIVGGAGGLIVYESINDAEYFKYAHEVIDAPAEWEGKVLRIHGYVEPGTIDEQIVGQTTQRKFYLESEGRRILVRNEGPKPDTFRDEAEVVAHGRLVLENGDYAFAATKLEAKCPSKYDDKRRTKTGPSGAQIN